AQVKSIEEVMVRMSLERQRIENAFATIEKVSDFSFVYTNKDVKDIPNISLENKSRSLYDILKEIALQTGLEFKQINNYILVQKSKKNFPRESVIIVDSEVTITGVVTDSSGE